MSSTSSSSCSLLSISATNSWSRCLLRITTGLAVAAVAAVPFACGSFELVPLVAMPVVVKEEEEEEAVDEVVTVTEEEVFPVGWDLGVIVKMLEEMGVDIDVETFEPTVDPELVEGDSVTLAVIVGTDDLTKVTGGKFEGAVVIEIDGGSFVVIVISGLLDPSELMLTEKSTEKLIMILAQFDEILTQRRSWSDRDRIVG